MLNMLKQFGTIILLLIHVYFTESNDVLKLKFQGLHTTIVNSVNPASVIDFLFQEKVISHDDVSLLRKSRDDPKQQSRDLLNLLHASENPQAFVQLYGAIKEEPHLQSWLTDRIDKFTDQSLTDLLQQQLNISEQTGQSVFERTKMSFGINHRSIHTSA